MQSSLSTNPSPTPIPNLFISDITIPSSPPQLLDHGITHVLTLLSSSHRPKIPLSLNVTHKIIEIDDDALADVLGILEEACTFIFSALSVNDSKVLVHCLQGISRSGAVIVAYMMKELDMGYEEALKLARKDRSVIAPNTGFAEQLQLWQRMGYEVWEEGKEKELYREWKEKRNTMVENAEEEMEVWESWRGMAPERW
jgi:dual specificity phosphatase 12